MAQIKNLITNEMITVAEEPTWIAGVWECGDQRFVDPAQTRYEVNALAPKPPSVTSTVFYDLFTITEMIDIEANKGSNPVVGQFYKRWQNAQADGTMIDLGTASVVEGLAYLSVTQVPVTAPTPAHTYIDPARIPVIQSGIPQ